MGFCNHGLMKFSTHGENHLVLYTQCCMSSVGIIHIQNDGIIYYLLVSNGVSLGLLRCYFGCSVIAYGFNCHILYGIKGQIEWMLVDKQTLFSWLLHFIVT